jgi:type 1 glutamine amidotransferase
MIRKCAGWGIVLTIVGLTMTGCAARLPSASGPIPAFNVMARPGTRVLVYTAGWMGISNGDSIRQYNFADSVAIDAITKIGQRHGFAVDTVTSRSTLTDARLARYAAVVSVTDGAADLLPQNQAALQRFIRRGGGFVGIWSVDGSEHSRPWYRRLLGTEQQLRGTDPRSGGRQVRGVYVIHTADSTHMSMKGVPDPWVIDEYYTEYAPLDPGVTVLATLDRRSFPKDFVFRNPSTGTQPIPVSWYHKFEGGRAWLTMLGTRSESYSDPAFLNHLAGGILWAAGQ